MRGVVVTYFPAKGLGFAKPDSGEHDVFVSQNEVVDGELFRGAAIEFDLRPDLKRNRERAVNIRVVDGKS